ncbi:unnamed protein product [Owenia fusiformis]|uniref:Uncharacterized protein n=1 Tax=Owenia fusiformis TaxID=6347 RepID=A0A8J1UD90_OWEFU|nr:unnamed protein product [Owenia fusiformis]
MATTTETVVMTTGTTTTQSSKGMADSHLTVIYVIVGTVVTVPVLCIGCCCLKAYCRGREERSERKRKEEEVKMRAARAAARHKPVKPKQPVINSQAMENYIKTINAKRLPRSPKVTPKKSTIRNKAKSNQTNNLLAVDPNGNIDERGFEEISLKSDSYTLENDKPNENAKTTKRTHRKTHKNSHLKENGNSKTNGHPTKQQRNSHSNSKDDLKMNGLIHQNGHITKNGHIRNHGDDEVFSNGIVNSGFIEDTIDDNMELQKPPRPPIRNGYASSKENGGQSGLHHSNGKTKRAHMKGFQESDDDHIIDIGDASEAMEQATLVHVNGTHSSQSNRKSHHSKKNKPREHLSSV